MKRVVVTMMVVVFAVVSAVAQNSPTAYSGTWGVGFRLGLAQNDPEDMKDTFHQATMFDRELTKNAGVFGLEVLYETSSDDINVGGFKIGFEGYGQNKLTLENSPSYVDEKCTETTYAVPVTLYYKRNGGIQNWSFWMGAGFTFLHTELEIKYSGYGTETLSNSKAFPHLAAGAEYRFNKLFALGFDVKYNIAAKVEKNDSILSNRSGIGGALTGRFYF